MPDWWLQSSGFFFIVGGIAAVLLLVLLGVLIYVSLELLTQVKRLAAKVETLTDKVNGIADQVQTITSEVGTRTTGIVKVVDDNASRAFELVEKIAPLLVGIGVVVRLARLLRRK